MIEVVIEKESHPMTSDKQPDNGFECPCLGQCPFFQAHESTMPDLAKKLKADYCLHDNSHCARLWVRDELGRELVPLQMMPHQAEWAEQILVDAGKTSTIYKRKARNTSC